MKNRETFFKYLFIFILFQNCGQENSQNIQFTDTKNYLKYTELNKFVGLFNYNDHKLNDDNLVSYLFRKFNYDSLEENNKNFNCKVKLFDTYYDSPHCYVRKYLVISNDDLNNSYQFLLQSCRASDHIQRIISISLYDKNINWLNILGILDMDLIDQMSSNSEEFMGNKLLVINSKKYSCRLFLFGNGQTVEYVEIRL